jgi:hypothetical protein
MGGLLCLPPVDFTMILRYLQSSPPKHTQYVVLTCWVPRNIAIYLESLSIQRLEIGQVTRDYAAELQACADNVKYPEVRYHVTDHAVVCEEQ